MKKIKYFIPVSKPSVTKSDIKSVEKSLKFGWISSEGPQVQEFEKKFASYIGCKYAAAVSNGTAALEIAIKALDLKKNDEVIIPNFTIISNLICILKQSLKFKTVDCNLNDWNINLDHLIKIISKKTKAIIATHIYNFPVEIQKLKKICKKNKIFLIEDAAEVLGQSINKKKCGSFGDISTFSFYANKQITTGEGGMITTNNKKLYNKFKDLRNLSFGKVDRFNHEEISWNYRITNMQCALGLNQLKRIDKIIKKKENVGKIYYKLLKNNKNIYIQKPKRKNISNIYWVIALVIVSKKITAKKLISKLKNYNIGSRPFFWPINKQKILKNTKLYNRKYPNSEFISKYGLYLPSSIDLKKKEISYICKVINKLTN